MGRLGYGRQRIDWGAFISHCEPEALWKERESQRKWKRRLNGTTCSNRFEVFSETMNAQEEDIVPVEGNPQRQRIQDGAGSNSSLPKIALARCRVADTWINVVETNREQSGLGGIIFPVTRAIKC